MLTKVQLVKAMVFPVVMYGCETWTIEKAEVKLLNCVQLFGIPWTVAHQAPPSMGFSRQAYWSGLPFPSPGNLPDPGIKPRSPTLQADALTSEPPGMHKFILRELQFKFYLGQNEDCSPGDSITDSS